MTSIARYWIHTIVLVLVVALPAYGSISWRAMTWRTTNAVLAPMRAPAGDPARVLMSDAGQMKSRVVDRFGFIRRSLSSLPVLDGRPINVELKLRVG
jgi:hypothetical protein